VNATASMMVNDIWRPVFRRDGGKPRESMLASYLASGLLVCCSMGCGYFFAENSSLNAVWMWMLGGLVACYVIPLALRWYWGRMNGWGFAAGSVAGLVPAFVLLYKGFAAEGAAVRQIPDDVFTYAILTISLLTCVVVSLLTKPVEEKHIDTFYRRVRPFGMWGAVRRRALAPGLPANEPIAFGRAMLNIVLGCIGMYSLYLSPVYLLGRWYGEASLAFGIFAAACVALYFTWPKNEPTRRNPGRPPQPPRPRLHPQPAGHSQAAGRVHPPGARPAGRHRGLAGGFRAEVDVRSDLAGARLAGRCR
jgi:hypothetical protein